MKRHALFVGVNDYADPSIRDLNCSAEDASELAYVFKNRLKFERVEKLLNPGHAPEVIDAVKELARGLGAGDLFFFFFAGHGFRVKENHVLVCAGDEYADLEDEYAGLAVGRLKKRLQGPWNRMLVLDACQSDIRESRGTDSGLSARDMERIHASETPTAGEGWQVVLTSCSERQSALEISELGHGLFTSALIGAVTEFADARRRLDLETLKADVASRMDGLAQKYRLVGKQDPLFTIPGSARLVLLDGSAPAPAVAPVAPPPVRASSLATVPALVMCPVCGKKNEPKDTFKCRECGREDLCLRHRDEESFLCEVCQAKERVLAELAGKGADLPMMAYKHVNIEDEILDLVYSDDLVCVLCKVLSGETLREAGDAVLRQAQLLEKMGTGATIYPAIVVIGRLRDEWNVQQSLSRRGIKLLRGDEDSSSDLPRLADYLKEQFTLIPDEERECAEDGEDEGEGEEEEEGEEDAEAFFQKGEDAYYGQNGAKQDFEAAVEWYLKAAEWWGHAGAQFSLGVMYANGHGVAKDEGAAVKWYRKAAEQGDATAQFNLGVMYECGRGVAKDEDEAAKWYRKAAAQGEEDAAKRLQALEKREEVARKVPSASGGGRQSGGTSPLALVVCPVCGKKNEPKDTFKCRECGREDLCVRHQDEGSFLCEACAEERERKAERARMEARLEELREKYSRIGREQARELAEWKAKKWRILVDRCVGVTAMLMPILVAFVQCRGLSGTLAETVRLWPWAQLHLKFGVGVGTAVALVAFILHCVIDKEAGSADKKADVVVSRRIYDEKVRPWADSAMPLAWGAGLVAWSCSVVYTFHVLGFCLPAFGVSALCAAEDFLCCIAAPCTWAVVHCLLWQYGHRTR